MCEVFHTGQRSSSFSHRKRDATPSSSRLVVSMPANFEATRRARALHTRADSELLRCITEVAKEC